MLIIGYVPVNFNISIIKSIPKKINIASLVDLLTNFNFFGYLFDPGVMITFKNEGTRKYASKSVWVQMCHFM